MLQPRTRLLAGVSVPDTAMIAAALEYAQRLSEPYLFNHAMRSWLFAARIGQLKAIDCDQEVVAVGTICTTSASPPVCQVRTALRSTAPTQPGPSSRNEASRITAHS